MTPTTKTDETQRIEPGQYLNHARHLYPGKCGGFNRWVRALAQELVNMTPPPRDAILSHHGLHFSFRGLAFRIAPFNLNEGPVPRGTMVVIMERPLSACDWKAAHGRPRHAGFKARTWKRLQAAAALAFGGKIITQWNGEDGHNSASFTMPTPAGLRWMEAAVTNYRNQPDVFRPTPEELTRAKTMNEWHKGIGDVVNVRRRRAVPDYHLINKADIEVGAGADAGKRLTLTGNLFTPADFPAAERREAFRAATDRIFSTAQAYFPNGSLIGITLYPNPQQ